MPPPPISPLPVAEGLSPSAWRTGWLPPFRLAGVDVRIHALALPVQAALAFARADTVDEGLSRFGVLVLLLGVVLLHELSHGFAARAIGLRVFDVRVHAIGGVARIERRPPPAWTPREEWFVALAGPVGNLLAAALTLGIAAAFGHEVPLDVRAWARDPLSAFAGGNAVLGIVNLVPAFPSDGGRVLRALLARRLSYLRATTVSLVVGAVVVVAGSVALVAAWGERALVGVLPLVAFLALYAAAERRVAVQRARFELFHRFVVAESSRFSALAALSLDAYGLPVPTAAVLEDLAIARAFEAFASGRPPAAETTGLSSPIVTAPTPGTTPPDGAGGPSAG